MYETMSQLRNDVEGAVADRGECGLESTQMLLERSYYVSRHKRGDNEVPLCDVDAISVSRKK